MVRLLNVAKRPFLNSKGRSLKTGPLFVKEQPWGRAADKGSVGTFKDRELIGRCRFFRVETHRFVVLFHERTGPMKDLTHLYSFQGIPPNSQSILDGGAG